MSAINSICVFCGSREGTLPEYRMYAEALGKELARRGIKLVYGGGNIGLMGAVSKSVIENGGHVLGVIPEGLRKIENTGELNHMVSHEGRVTMVVVKNMHARKTIMSECADAFIAMPGGYGTLEELFEMVTWTQLGIHDKPIGILNVEGYYDLLIKFLDGVNECGFMSSPARTIIRESDNPSELIDLLHTPSQYKNETGWKKSEVEEIDGSSLSKEEYDEWIDQLSSAFPIQKS
jgi:uncharacterized protein (TIGR00730 family)